MLFGRSEKQAAGTAFQVSFLFCSNTYWSAHYGGISVTSNDLRYEHRVLTTPAHIQSMAVNPLKQ